MPEATRVEKSVQLLVEGFDLLNFVEAYLDHLGIHHVQVQNFGGVGELRGFLLALVDAPGFRETVQSIGIVRDAEDSAASAFQSVQSSLRNAKLPAPDGSGEHAPANPAVTVLILPDGKREGMLETLLCETIAGTPEDECIDTFFECVNGASAKRPEKARARAYLTTKPYPHLSVGVAAKRGYWDSDHDALGSVRDFLLAL